MALTDNLLSYYTFETNNKLVDETGSNNSVSATAATIDNSGKVGNALDFNGSTSIVNFGDASDFDFGTGDWTVNFWVKPDDLTGHMVPVSKSDGSFADAGSYGIQIRQTSGVIDFFRQGGGAGQIQTTNDTISAGSWSMITVTCEYNTAIKIYINGSESSGYSSTYTSWASLSSSLNFQLGQYGGNVRVLAGLMDETAIWDRELSSSEVSDLYNSGSPQTYHGNAGEFIDDDDIRVSLVSYWDFEQNETFPDQVSNNDGTIGGTTFTNSGKVGNARSFDGNDDYVDIGDIEDFDNSKKITMSCWFKTSVGYDSTNRVVFGKVWSDWCYNLVFLNPDDKLRFRIDNTADAVSNSSVADGSWHHAVGVYDGTLGSDNLKLYIDGVLQTTTGSNTSAIANTSDWLAIGCARRSGSPAEYDFTGEVDEAGIWSRALSSSEVTELYNSGDGKTYSQGTGEFIDHDDMKVSLISYYKSDTDGSYPDAHRTYDCTENATYTASGKINGAYTFNGSTEYILTPDSTLSTTRSGVFSFGDDEDWSISLWYKGTQSGVGGSQAAYGLVGRDGSDIYSNLSVRNGKAEYPHYDGSWQHNIISTTSINDDSWHHVVYVNHSNVTGDLYVDGSQEVTGVASGIDANRYFTVTHFMRTYNGEYTSGSLDEVGIWGRALDSSEVTTLYNSGSGLAYPFSAGPSPPGNAANSIFFGTNM